MTAQELHAQAAAGVPLSPAAIELLARQLERMEAELALIRPPAPQPAAPTAS